MAASHPCPLRRAALTHRSAPRRRSGNRCGKDSAGERVVRRHLPPHLPDECRSIAARETHARDRVAWDACCSSRKESARIECIGGALGNKRSSDRMNEGRRKLPPNPKGRDTSRSQAVQIIPSYAQ